VSIKTPEEMLASNNQFCPPTNPRSILCRLNWHADELIWPRYPSDDPRLCDLFRCPCCGRGIVRTSYSSAYYGDNYSRIIPAD
jgi:hypothetical protein